MVKNKNYNKNKFNYRTTKKNKFNYRTTKKNKIKYNTNFYKKNKNLNYKKYIIKYNLLKLFYCKIQNFKFYFNSKKEKKFKKLIHFLLKKKNDIKVKINKKKTFKIKLKIVKKKIIYIVNCLFGLLYNKKKNNKIINIYNNNIFKKNKKKKKKKYIFKYLRGKKFKKLKKNKIKLNNKKNLNILLYLLKKEKYFSFFNKYYQFSKQIAFHSHLNKFVLETQQYQNNNINKDNIIILMDSMILNLIQYIFKIKINTIKNKRYYKKYIFINKEYYMNFINKRNKITDYHFKKYITKVIRKRKRKKRNYINLISKYKKQYYRLKNKKINNIFKNYILRKYKNYYKNRIIITNNLNNYNNIINNYSNKINRSLYLHTYNKYTLLKNFINLRNYLNTNLNLFDNIYYFFILITKFNKKKNILFKWNEFIKKINNKITPIFDNNITFLQKQNINIKDKLNNLFNILDNLSLKLNYTKKHYLINNKLNIFIEKKNIYLLKKKMLKLYSFLIKKKMKNIFYIKNKIQLNWFEEKYKNNLIKIIEMNNFFNNNNKKNYYLFLLNKFKTIYLNKLLYKDIYYNNNKLNIFTNNFLSNIVLNKHYINETVKIKKKKKLFRNIYNRNIKYINLNKINKLKNYNINKKKNIINNEIKKNYSKMIILNKKINKNFISKSKFNYHKITYNKKINFTKIPLLIKNIQDTNFSYIYISMINKKTLINKSSQSLYILSNTTFNIKKNILKIKISNTNSNSRYLISDFNNKILRSSSIGCLKIMRKERRLKKLKQKLGEHLILWTRRIIKKKKKNTIFLYNEGVRRIIRPLYYKFKYYLRKRTNRIKYYFKKRKKKLKIFYKKKNINKLFNKKTLKLLHYY
jgi:hypothetical protein